MAFSSTPTSDEVFAAIDRLGAGFGVKRRYIDMSMGRAQDILRAAVHELVELRSESRNYVCTRCRQVFGKPANVLDPSCPHCESLLRPEAVVQRAAFETRIDALEANVRRLEDSLRAVLDLD